MKKKIFLTATILGLTALFFGAYATHGLRQLISNDSFESFQTGIRYQLYHALFLFIIGILPILNLFQRKIIFYLVLIGVILFSGSIYLLSTNSLTNTDFISLGILTPVGGLALIFGWIILAYYIFINKSHK